MQCSNCDSLFTQVEFLKHVCDYDSNQKPIKSEKSKKHPVFAQLEENLKAMQKLMQSMNKTESDIEKAAPSTYQCNVCRRKFVRESGLTRHLDKHVGELIPPQKPTSEFLLGARCMCGQVFGEDRFAFEHVQNYHLCEKDEGLWKKPWSHAIFDDDDKEKIIPIFPKVESTAKNKNCNDPTKTAAKEKDSSKDSNGNNIIEEEEKPQILPGVKFEPSSIYDIIKPIYLHMTLQCEFCETLFSDTRSLLNHSSEHNPMEGFRCNRCDLNCMSLKNLMMHRMSSCIELIENEEINSLEKVFICNVCYEEFGSLEKLVEHR